MDNLTPEQRSKNMRNIRSKNTEPERILAKELKKHKISFSQNNRSLLGKPDFVFRRRKLVVFVDSCFWHSCPYHFIKPKSKKHYWNPKIKRNKERDKEVTRWYKKNGWTILRFWEHSIKRNAKLCIKKIEHRN